VQSVQPGTGISVNATDPANPIVINAGVRSVTGGSGITVDNSDPRNPVVANGAAFPGFGIAPPGVSQTSDAGTAPTVSHSDHTHAGVASVVAGTGIAVNVADPANPIVTNTAPFAGFGAAPPSVAAASSAGVASTASRSDHTHAGVASVTGGSGIVVTGTADAPIVSATATSFPGFGGAPPVAAAASAAGAASTASRSDHTHAAGLEAGSYLAPLATRHSGVLQQTVSGSTATLDSAQMPAGRVPAGTATGTGVLRTDDSLFYEDDPNGPRLNLGIDQTWTNDTNIGAGLRLYSATPATVTVVRLNGRDTCELQFWQGTPVTDELPISTVKGIDGADGSTSGAVRMFTRQSTGGGGALIDCGGFEGGGLIVQGQLAVGPTGVGQSTAGASFINLQEKGTPPTSNSGQANIRYRTTGGGGNDWPQLGVNGGAYADMARAGQGAAIASGATLTLGSDGNTFHVTGTTTIDNITTARLPPGHPLYLYFNSALTLTHAGAAPGGTLPLQLVGATNASMAAGSKIILQRDSTQAAWVEWGRSGA
jgi:hypothetical protein